MDGEDGNNFISKNRLEALVDAVFAFAMTLLVIGLSVPAIPKADAAAELPPYLASMVPQFLSFLIAFFVLASFWVGHHRHFHYLRAVDRPVLWINLLILIFVVLVPFTTDLSGDYSHVQLAVVFFHANMLFLGLLFLVHWQYIIRHPLLEGIMPAEFQEREGTAAGLVMILAACTGIAISFLTPSGSFYAYMFVPVAARVLSFIRHRCTKPG